MGKRYGVAIVRIETADNHDNSIDQDFKSIN